MDLSTYVRGEHWILVATLEHMLRSIMHGGGIWHTVREVPYMWTLG